MKCVIVKNRFSFMNNKILCVIFNYANYNLAVFHVQKYYSQGIENIYIPISTFIYV